MDEDEHRLESSHGVRQMRSLKELSLGIFEAMFSEPSSTAARIAVWVWMAGLFVAGCWLWYYFLNGGHIQFDLHDWGEVTSPRFAFLQDAVRKGVLPLHMPLPAALRNVTDRFLSVPDTDISPLVLLLRWVSLGQFMVLNTLLLYAAGFVGLLLLRRRLSLSAMAFSLLFGLLFFNGHLAAHLAVGHENWTAYFLLPFFAYLVLELSRSPRPWRWTLYLSLLELVIVLQGAFHLFVATLLFLGLLAFSLPKKWKVILASLIAAGLVASVRIFPALLVAGKFDTAFLSGFTSLGELLRGMTSIVHPIPSQAMNTAFRPLGWWEVDYYVGFAGLGFMIGFGLLTWIRQRRRADHLRALWFPMLTLTVASIGLTYKLVHVLRIPLLDSERVASRLFILPFLFLAVLAALNLQRVLDRQRHHYALQLTLAGAMIVLANDLWQNFKAWRVYNMSQLFPHKLVDLGRDVVANHADPIYMAAIVLGVTATVLSLAILGVLTAREASAGSGHLQDEEET